MNKLYIFTLLLLIGYKISYAQQTPLLVSINYQGVTIDKMVADLQAQTNYR